MPSPAEMDFHFRVNLFVGNLFRRNEEQLEAREVLAIIRCRIFCLPVCYTKILKFKIYINLILLVVLYGCETLSLTTREERRLRVFENRVLRRISGPKTNDVTGERRRIHDEELNDL